MIPVRKWVKTHRNAGATDDGVAADVIRVCAGIDDETDRTRRDRLDGFQKVVRPFTRAAVDQNETIGPHVDGDVRAGAENDVDVRPDLDRFEAGRDCRRMLLRKKC